ncbi:1,4-dihydroxy-2-naphthoate octaprenyltransferase [Saonia flava]|uniref:1,4-dihydroxy-2-naphthoate octaprenyltransferase n=1 Tax=Saonia flava TaxID=523696 RepID=A0A846QRP2_9FLAO|nr:1,4-dihydroxy-2-naphthoate octaprenyltransferase [Saonia flava]NJB69650.1 1,4-dihydroxy-2-naphthoate octaprenyltransferase [Saonia flava]
MTKAKAWFSAARLRTLPLSVSGIIVGAAIANKYGYTDWLLFWLAIFTTIGFQITSNFANDYGDGIKGTDNEDRIGPKRALQSGLLTRKELKSGIRFSVLLCLLLVVLVVYRAFGTENIVYPLVFIFLGIASIWAAIKYTVGKSAYGYRGFGDVFVFIFFGLLSVLGSMFIFTKFLTVYAVLPAISIGLLSTGVLNLNNLRDYESDKKSKKNTLVVILGYTRGKKYHYLLLSISFICMLLYTIFNYLHLKNMLVLLGFIPIFLHLIKVRNIKKPILLDPELKKIALSTFLVAILFYIAFNKFL